MKKLLKIIGIAIAAIALLISLLLVASRFSDGPLVEMLPGGPFKTGEIVTEGPNDWGFLAERMTVEFQSDGRSRITWIHILEGNAYIGASLGFPPFKTWHESALKDPTAVLRIDGKRYPRQMTKIEDEDIRAQLKELGEKKYGGSPDPTSDTWYFRFDPPT